MSTKLNFGRDKTGLNAFAPAFSENNFSASLLNGSEETFTIPESYKEWIVAFSYQPGTVNWVSVNATATVPAGATFATTNSALNPGARSVKGGDVIHMITENATSSVGASLYFVGKEM